MRMKYVVNTTVPVETAYLQFWDIQKRPPQTTKTTRVCMETLNLIYHLICMQTATCCGSRTNMAAAGSQRNINFLLRMRRADNEFNINDDI